MKKLIFSTIAVLFLLSLIFSVSATTTFIPSIIGNYSVTFPNLATNRTIELSTAKNSIDTMNYVTGIGIYLNYTNASYLIILKDDTKNQEIGGYLIDNSSFIGWKEIPLNLVSYQEGNFDSSINLSAGDVIYLNIYNKNYNFTLNANNTNNPLSNISVGLDNDSYLDVNICQGEPDICFYLPPQYSANKVNSSYDEFYLNGKVFSFYMTGTSFPLTDCFNPSGLLAYWDFDDNSSSVIDKSGNGNNGTAYNITFVTNGEKNGAFYFNGINSYVDVGNKSDINNLTKGFTYSLWFNQPVLNSLAYIIAQKNDSIDFGFNDYIYSNQEIEVYNGNLSNQRINTGFYASDINRWHNLVIVINSTGNGFTPYYDGVMGNASIPFFPFNTNNSINVEIGDRYGGVGFFNGTIDEVKIFNRELSSSEVSGLYNDNECSLITPTITGNLIYDIMNSAGAGLGLFIEYIGQALFVLLIVIALAVMVFIIGSGIAEAVRNMFQNKNGISNNK